MWQTCEGNRTMTCGKFVFIIAEWIWRGEPQFEFATCSLPGNLWIRPRCHPLTRLPHPVENVIIPLLSCILHAEAHLHSYDASAVSSFQVGKHNVLFFFFFFGPDLINAPIKKKENWLPKGNFARALLIKS